METQQEEILMGSNHMIFKGKRTKRQRTTSQPFLLTMATTTSSSSCSSGEAIPGGGGVFGDHFSHNSSSGFERLTTSPSNSGELTQSSVEEEDMANCLILLAQGHAQKSTQVTHPIHHLAMTSTTTKSSSAVHDAYHCKTCNRSFPSFQALGGHRASHKKPKTTLEEKNHTPAGLSLGGHPQESSVGLIKDEDTTLSLQIPSTRDLCRSNNNNKSRVHECSICGAEFTSGQALGGHMRRHRPLPMVTSTNSTNDEGSQEAVKKPRTLLSLDLNLPAAPDQVEDDYSRASKCPFSSSKEQVIVFSASHHPLVDCHY